MKRLLFLVLVVGLGFYVGWPAWSGYQIKSALETGDAGTLRQKIDFVSVRRSLRPAADHYAKQMLDDALRSANSPVTTVLDDSTKNALLPKVVEGTLDRVVTPENLIRIASQGGSIKDAVAKIVKEQMGGALGGLSALTNIGKVKIGEGEDGSGGRELDVGELVGGIVGAVTGNDQGLGDLFGNKPKDAPQANAEPEPAAAPEPKKAAKKQKFGLSNIKSFGFAGPLGLQVGVAQDAKAKGPDVTAEMGFRDMDWKLVAIRPKF